MAVIQIPQVEVGQSNVKIFTCETEILKCEGSLNTINVNFYEYVSDLMLVVKTLD